MKFLSIVLLSLMVVTSVMAVLPATYVVNPIYRDFRFKNNPAAGNHPDFQAFSLKNDTGIVANTLGADGKPVYLPGASGTTPTTTGKVDFDLWWNGGNLITGQTLTFPLVGSSYNLYKFQSFFPIDNLGFGNEGQFQGTPHNFAFTTQIDSSFRYCGGEFFVVGSDDDSWFFIDNKLQINNGGLHGLFAGSVSVDAIAAGQGLVKGNIYNWHLFEAERHTPGSSFQFQTNADPSLAACAIITGDPHFTGVQNEKYDVTGEADKWFNIVSDPKLQYNALFTQTCENKPQSTILSAVALKISGHELMINITGNAILDGVELKPNGWKPTMIGDKQGTFVQPWINYFVVETDDYYFTFTRMIVDKAEQIPGHDFYGVNCFIGYFNVHFSTKSASVNPHGLLGQTAHHVHLTQHITTNSKQGEGEIEGTYQDYIVSSPFADDFKFNQYNF